MSKEGSTKDYDKFKHMAGNRRIDEKHVASLKRRMRDKGNLTKDFPIIINKNWEVIDGQHTLEAVRQLGWEVGYRMVEEANAETVRTINNGRRNWTWRDYALSWVDSGKKDYEQFMTLADFHPNMSFTALIAYATLNRISQTGGGGGIQRIFRDGDFKMVNYELSRELLDKYAMIVDSAGINDRNFAIAVLRFLRRPGISHMRLIDKVAEYGDRLSNIYYVNDYYAALEEIYNAQES